MIKSEREKQVTQSNAAADPQADEPTGKEASLSPPVLNLGKDPVAQAKSGEEKENKESTQEQQTDDNFDIDFDLLPPELRLKIFELGLNADVKGVSISHQAKSLGTKLNFGYDGAASLNLDHGELDHTLGYDFGSSNLSYAGRYKEVNWGTNYNIDQKSFGLSLGFGAALRPSKEDVNNTFQAGAEGLNNVAGNISSITDDPVKYADDNKDNISAITKAVSMARKIRKMNNKPEFGAGLRLGYSPERGLSVFVGAQMRF